MFLYPYPHTGHFSEATGWTQQDNRVAFSADLLHNNGRPPTTLNGKSGLTDLGDPCSPTILSQQIQIPEPSSLLSDALTSQHFQQLDLEADQKPILDEYNEVLAASISGYNVGKREKCRACGEELLQSDVIQHMRNHMGPRRCEICNYEAPTKHHLREHLNTHTGLKPYKCQFCDKSFAAKNSLRVHTMYLHTKVRAHQCHFCDQRFVTTSERKSHELVHTDKCPVCQMSFRLRGHLRQHMKSHANSAFHHKKR